MVGGRVGRLKSSVILPRHHRLSEVIVLEYHSSSHLGTEWLLSLLRERFWIIRARSLIQKIKRRCCVCRKMYGSPMCQKMANLPPERCLPDHPPFTNTGVDLFGPLHVKLGRSDVKRYRVRLQGQYISRSWTVSRLIASSMASWDSLVEEVIHPKYGQTTGQILWVPRRNCPEVFANSTGKVSLQLRGRKWWNGPSILHWRLIKGVYGSAKYALSEESWSPSLTPVLGCLTRFFTPRFVVLRQTHHQVQQWHLWWFSLIPKSPSSDEVRFYPPVGRLSWWRHVPEEMKAGPTSFRPVLEEVAERISAGIAEAAEMAAGPVWSQSWWFGLGHGWGFAKRGMAFGLSYSD